VDIRPSGYPLRARMSERSLPTDAVLEVLPDALLVADERGEVVLANASAERLLGRGRSELVGRPLDSLLHRGLETTAAALDASGERLSVVVVREAGGGDRLRHHARQQEAVASLGQRALAGEHVHVLMQEAARLLADVLDVDFVEVLELQPGREWFVMRGAWGWDGDQPDVPVANSLVGESLDRGAPLVVPDTAAEPEHGAGLLLELHGVVSGLAVPMLVAGREEGAVGVFSRRPRDFTEDEVHFAQAVANVVASALERRRAEAELETSYQRLQAVIDASPAVIYLKDLEGRLILANRGFEDLFGVLRGSALGRRNPDFIAGAEAAAAIDANDAAVAAAGEPLELEERLWIGDDERIYISLKFPLREAGGAIIGVGGVSTDVTERIRAMEEREALEARLSRAERLESVGQLAGGIAHDFNNLLAVIANYAGFLQTAVPAGSEAADDVEQILVASRAATELTRRLLLFSRRRAGNPEVIDVTTVIAETQRLLGRTLGERVDVRTAVEPDLAPVHADRSQLEQVLMNLAINARDAMPEGGTLTIAATNVELPPNTVPGMAGAAVCLVVSDTGTGMPAEVADRAFEPFFTTKQAGEGTGLGLATVYGIVRGAGGHVDLRSGDGGTDVVVHLPASSGPLSIRTGEERSAPQPARGERVLLVEDKEAVRVLTERILKDAGYSVRTAAEGLEALELHGGHSEDLDVLITDIVMPGLSGRELADEMRHRRPGLPVVFVSGYTEDYVVEEAGREGATAFVEKPFAAADLLAAVRSVIDEASTST
jgi:two-component system cell cycle sensor histidine kinase/response regulator CckA